MYKPQKQRTRERTRQEKREALPRSLELVRFRGLRTSHMRLGTLILALHSYAAWHSHSDPVFPANFSRLVLGCIDATLFANKPPVL